MGAGLLGAGLGLCSGLALVPVAGGLLLAGGALPAMVRFDAAATGVLVVTALGLGAGSAVLAEEVKVSLLAPPPSGLEYTPPSPQAVSEGRTAP